MLENNLQLGMWRLNIATGELFWGHFAVIAAIFLVLGWRWFQSPWPIWVFFVPIVALLALGVRQTRRN